MAMSREQLEAQVMERAMKDEAFRQALKQNPAATLEREYGIKVPMGMKLNIHEESGNTMHFVLPKASAQAGSELSDQDLEMAAGGKSGPSGCVTQDCNTGTCQGASCDIC